MVLGREHSQSQFHILRVLFTFKNLGNFRNRFRFDIFELLILASTLDFCVEWHTSNERQQRKIIIIIQFSLFKYLSVSVSNGNLYQSMWLCVRERARSRSRPQRTRFYFKYIQSCLKTKASPCASWLLVVLCWGFRCAAASSIT